MNAQKDNKSYTKSSFKPYQGKAQKYQGKAYQGKANPRNDNRLSKPWKKPHYFTRTIVIPGCISNGDGTTNGAYGSMSFALSGVVLNYSAGSPCAGVTGTYPMPNAAEFTSLFDKYSIRKIVIKFVPRNNITSQVNDATTLISSQYVTVVKDYNDVATTFSHTDLLQFSNQQQISTTDVSTITLVPAVSEMLFNSAITTAYGQRFKAWIDTSSPDAPLYGIKMYAPGTPTAVGFAGFKLDAFIKYYIACKQVK